MGSEDGAGARTALSQHSHHRWVGACVLGGERFKRCDPFHHHPVRMAAARAAPQVGEGGLAAAARLAARQLFRRCATTTLRLEPQTRVPPYPALLTHTDMCLSPLALSQVARHSPPTPPLWRSAAGSLTVAAAARPAIAPTTQAVRRALAAPMCDGASGVCTCVCRCARREGRKAAAGSFQLPLLAAARWQVAVHVRRVCREVAAAHRA